MAIYVKTLNIEAFKGIQNLTLDHLNHINILTGENNSGKTSILELLRTLENPLSFMTWYRNTRPSRYISRGSVYNSILNVFPIDEEQDKFVRYTYLGHDDSLHFVQMNGEVEERLITQKQLHTVDGSPYDSINKIDEPDGEELYDANCLRIEISTDTDTAVPAHYEIYDLQEIPPRSFRRKKAYSGVKAIYVSPTDHANVFSLDDVLSDTELYSEMLTILKEFDGDIINITASDRKPEPEYMILTRKHKKALPLSSYGDGMKKAMLLLSSMLSAQNGILLLDEFETAIHTSAMDRVFSWLLKSAMQLNVQVFLTSHSLEAINKVLRCDTDLLPDISYYTLFTYQGKNLVRYLSAEDAILLQDQGGMDLR